TSSPVSPTAGPAQQTVAVYYALTAEGRGPRLVREFHKISAQDGSVPAQVRAAVTEMLSRNAIDPDYRNLWPPAARVANVSISGQTATVDLTGATVNSLGAEAAHIAVQQLVWTVTAVPNLVDVSLRLDGRPANDLWGHVDVSKPLRRGSAVDVLALVWLISPQHGDKVGREVTLHIAGIAFEATVHYEVRQGTAVVKQGFVTLNNGAPQQGEAKQVVTLEPGEYVISAFLISPKDSAKEFADDHAVVVS
ncbi:MAG TPA: hypothetical protein DGT23_35125, partial [Micromonosporaceae bacterium]|nr:hypothetical protein [Micromonosporaceae bacterium]